MVDTDSRSKASLPQVVVLEYRECLRRTDSTVDTVLRMGLTASMLPELRNRRRVGPDAFPHQRVTSGCQRLSNSLVIRNKSPPPPGGTHSTSTQYTMDNTHHSVARAIAPRLVLWYIRCCLVHRTPRTPSQSAYPLAFPASDVSSCPQTRPAAPHQQLRARFMSRI
jgi:hypothetical protein